MGYMELYIVVVSAMAVLVAAITAPRKEEKWIPSSYFITEMKLHTAALRNANEQIKAKSLLK